MRSIDLCTVCLAAIAALGGCGGSDDSADPDAARSIDAASAADAASGPDATPPPLADSVAEYSDQQGQDSWNYGYWDLTADEAGGDGQYDDAEFQLMTEFYEPWSNWEVQHGDGGFWTSVSDDGTHPNGLEGYEGRQAVEHWAIRRWVSEVTGDVSITGELSKREGTTGGDGVVGMIFVDGVEQYTQAVAGSDDVGYTYSICVSVTVGSNVDFAISAGDAGDDGSDSSHYTALVRAEPAGCS